MEDLANTGIMPSVVNDLRARARKWGIRKLVVFGSRARGDHHQKSDIDLAIAGGDQVRFVLEVEEETPTLLSFDIVDLDSQLSEELRAAIKRDGRIIYEEI